MVMVYVKHRLCMIEIGWVLYILREWSRCVGCWDFCHEVSSVCMVVVCLFRHAGVEY